jgi:hypothetical protein
MKDNKQKLFEVMARLDKTFKPELNEGSITNTNEFLPITTPIGSDDDKLFIDVVNKGIDSHLEGFIKSKFGTRDNRRIFDFHISELPILLRRLEEIGTDEALQWKSDIESSDNNMNEDWWDQPEPDEPPDDEHDGDDDNGGPDSDGDYNSEDSKNSWMDYVNENKTRQKLFRNMGRLDKTFKPQLNEESKYGVINNKYTHFAILKSSNKILNGWDYRGIDPEELRTEKKYYFFQDLIDNDISPQKVLIYSRQTLKKMGINPFDANSWYKYEADKSIGEGNTSPNNSNNTILNGMNNAKARRIVSTIAQKGYHTGIYKDESWEGIHGIYKVLDNAGIDYDLLGSKYSPEFPNLWKEWKLSFKFINDKGRETELIGTITAAGAGSTEQPLERYDVNFTVY